MDPLKNRPIQKKWIVIHHSVSADHPTLGNVGAIRNYHVNVNGWSTSDTISCWTGSSGRTEIVLAGCWTSVGRIVKSLDFNVIRDWDMRNW
jgi:hypothetical protein